jgi:hypothetical protein
VKKRTFLHGFTCALLVLGTSLADRVVTLEGDLLDGNVIGIDAENGLLLEDQDPWPLEKLRSIVPSAQSENIEPAPYTVWLTNGSRFSTRVLELREETYHLDNPILGELEVPIDLVWAVRLGRPDADSRFARSVRAMVELEEDTIYVTGTGTSELQEVHGLIEELNQDGLSFDQNGDLKVLPANQVHGVLLASPPFEPDTDAWITSRLTLSDGSLISGNVTQLQDAKMAVQLGEGMRIDLAWAQVRRMTIESDLLHYLSDLEPVEVKTEAIYALPRTWKRDVNVRGGALSLGQDLFEKGLGVGAGTALTFSNNDDYTIFTATIGIDAARTATGDCEFVILSGEKELFRQRLRSGEPAQFVKLEVEDLEKITLVVDPGTLGLDLADDANWCEACFLQLED